MENEIIEVERQNAKLKREMLLMKEKHNKWEKVFIVFMVFSIITMSYLGFNCLKQKNGINQVLETLDIEADNLGEANKSALELMQELDQYHRDFAYITVSGTKYHKYHCWHLKDKELYIDNIPNLKDQGYFPCEDCY